MRPTWGADVTLERAIWADAGRGTSRPVRLVVHRESRGDLCSTV